MRRFRDHEPRARAGGPVASAPETRGVEGRAFDDERHGRTF